MTREQKRQVVVDLTEKLNNSDNFYVTDASTLTVAQVNEFRELCYKNDVEYKVYKNTLIKKAMEAAEGNYDDLYDVLAGPSSIMFSEIANVPARTLKEFRKTFDKPILKAAYIDTDVIKGDDQIESLSSLKSKEELIGEVVGLLQSPIKNVLGALQSGGQTISGLLKALEEK